SPCDREDVAGSVAPGNSGSAGRAARLARPPDLVPQLDHAGFERARRGELQRLRQPAIEERLAFTQDDWHDGQVQLVQQPRVGELRGGVAPGAHPEISLPGRAGHAPTAL